LRVLASVGNRKKQGAALKKIGSAVPLMRYEEGSLLL